MLDYYNGLITKALTRVYDVAIETPLTLAAPLSLKLNNTIYMKREDMQPVFSFKLRGAYNHMCSLSQADLDKGVIASSAGNHAQGVALAAKKLGVKATIVMPKTTPGIKVKAVAALGAHIVLHGDIYDEAYAKALELKETEGLTYIHPYDVPNVIAGQGTIGFEIIKQCRPLPDIIFAPIGGGGLMSGIATYIKYHHPEIKVIAVEANDSACFNAALKADKRVNLDHVGIFADGTAVRIVGEETFKILKEQVDESITVTSDQICAAVKDIFENTRTLVEPAGALAIAGMKAYIAEHKLENKVLVAVNSGANVNFDRLRDISERAEMGENKEVIFSATIPEKPGSFKEFCTTIGENSVTEFNYRYTDSNQAQIFVGIEIGKDNENKKPLLESLTHKGYPIVDLTDNELAKVHIKHMIGGKSPSVDNERVFRVQFPERPGALMNFLKTMKLM